MKNKFRNKLIILTVFLAFMIITPVMTVLIRNLNRNQNNSININTSSDINYSGVYNGGISTMGMKVNPLQKDWDHLNNLSTSIPNNLTYSGYPYLLNRLDIRTYNIYNGTDIFPIAFDDSQKSGVENGSVIAQKFTTPNDVAFIAIENISLYINHTLSKFGTNLGATYWYKILIYDDEMQELLSDNEIRITKDEFTRNEWVTFNLSSNILEANKNYTIVYYIIYRWGNDYVVSDNSWLVQNNTASNVGLTMVRKDSEFIPIVNDSSRDMLCTFTYKNIINPETVDLKYKINNIEYKPIYQKTLWTGSLGYEAFLTFNFNAPQNEAVNVSIFSNTTIPSLKILLIGYYIYTINTTGTYQINDNIISWNITYPYRHLGDYSDDTFRIYFLYESDWHLLHFYNTYDSELQDIYYGPMKLFNDSYFALFDIWGTPMEVGNCSGVFQSINYCNNILTSIKTDENFENKGYLQLGKTIKLEAVINDALDQPITGGNGTITFKDPSGQALYQENNLSAYNGLLSSSEYYLDTNQPVGIYTIDIFWSNGKEIAIYTISVDVIHPEGYISPETMILIISLIGMAIFATPAVLVIKKRIRQINWEKKLNDLFVLTKDGAGMYNFSFGVELRKPELIAGMISALTTFMKEATGSKEALRIIDQQDKKIILNHGKYVIVALVCTKDLPIIHKRVKKFTETFESRYGKQLLKWNGEITMFKDAESIVKNYFPVSIEEQQIRGVKQKLLEFRERLLSVDEKAEIISILREITEFSSRYQQIINNYSFKDLNELIQIAEYKINE